MSIFDFLSNPLNILAGKHTVAAFKLCSHTIPHSA